MKTIFDIATYSCFCVLLLLSVNSYGQAVDPSPMYMEAQNLCDPNEYELIFEDNFNGTELDTDKWIRYFDCFNNGGTDEDCVLSRTKTPSEGQIYRDENVRVEGGSCFLDVKKEVSTWFDVTRNYTSGVILSKQNFPTFGKFEIRCKVPKGYAVFPAFWVFGGENEIDIFESYGDASKIEVSVHDYSNGTGASTPPSPNWDNHLHLEDDLSEDFHILGMEYDENHIRFYIDNVLLAWMPRYFYYDEGTVVNGCDLDEGIYLEHPEWLLENQPMRICANFALIGDPASNNEIDENTMEIDYIKAYKRVETCESNNYVLVIEDETLENETKKVSDMLIRNNATFILKDSEFQVANLGEIRINSGSTLVLDNSIIGPCDENDRWNGIFLEEGANIELKNGSKIYQSNLGIYNNPDLSDYIEYTGGIDFAYLYSNIASNTGNNSVIINNSTLEDNFSSIVLDGDNNDISISNDSYIKSSNLATSIRGNENGAFAFESSHFEENDVSLYASSCGDKNTIYECDFVNDWVLFPQIRLKNVDGLDFQMNKMEGPGSLFSAVESHVELINDNEFLNSARGVYVGATAPLLGSATVGSIGTAANFFSGNLEGIRLHGLNSPIRSNIINNKIVNSDEIGIAINGIGLYTINNNNIENTNDGIYFSKSGSLSNNINCNKFEDNDKQDLTIELDNSLTLFLQNDFSNSDNKGNIILKQASVQNLQGGLTNPSDNCFNSSADEDLHTDGTTSTFNYFHNQDINCREPLSTGTYTKTRVAGLGANCLNGIGSNFVDINPNSGFNLAHLPDMFEPITPGILNTNVNNTLNDVIAIGGDDPFTYVDESTTNTEILPNQSYPIAYLDNIQAIYDLEEELDYWIRAGIYYAIQNEDYTYGENLLLPYKKWRWQEMLVGLYMKSKQYTKARALLTSLPSNNQYETEFKALEHINLDRLLHGEGSITSAQNTTVYNIATGITPAAGYAIPLYYILTAQHIQSTVPSKGSNKRSLARIDNDEINIIPNPVTDNLAIVNLGSKLIGDVQILDQYNRVQLSISADNLDNVDVSILATGWYILRGVTTESKIVTVSFIKQ